MTHDEVMSEFKEAGALLRGHFILSSGLRSDTYFNKSILGMYPARVERLCRVLAQKLRASFSQRPAYVVSPALGAIVFGYETARHLDTPFLFLERKDGGGFELKRGFTLPEDAPVVVVEDVISTGLSAREVCEGVRAAGGQVLGVGALMDRSGGTADVGAPVIALASIKVDTWPADALPPHLAAIKPEKIGSRKIAP